MMAEQRTYLIHPQKFLLWLFIISVIMVFGGLTSAYIVQRSFVRPDQQVLFALPDVLWYNLALALLSSVTMQLSLYWEKLNQMRLVSLALGMTLVLGCLFLLGQWQAFEDMTAGGLPFVDRRRLDNSVSYFYVFTGLHGAHIVSAVITVLVLLVRSLLNRFPAGRRRLIFEMSAVFWHFLGLLWVYLFVFLNYTQR
jgi:cytochrome c oxidase subunit 3